MIPQGYRQDVNGKARLTILVFLTRLIKLACGFCSIVTPQALSVLHVHRAAVGLRMITVPSGRQRHVEMNGSLVACVTITDSRNCGRHMEAATITVVTSHIVGRRYFFNVKGKVVYHDQ
jgi:hypothetical protein